MPYHPRDAAHVGAEIAALDRGAFLELARRAIEREVGEVFRIGAAPPPVQSDEAVAELAVRRRGCLAIVVQDREQPVECAAGEGPGGVRGHAPVL